VYDVEYHVLEGRAADEMLLAHYAYGMGMDEMLYCRHWRAFLNEL
jgi:hypothetical protein